MTDLKDPFDYQGNARKLELFIGPVCTSEFEGYEYDAHTCKRI